MDMNEINNYSMPYLLLQTRDIQKNNLYLSSNKTTYLSFK